MEARERVVSLCLLAAFTAGWAHAQYHRGPRGGCYTITKSGGKRYVDRALCGESGASTATGRAERSGFSGSADPDSRRYHRGPRGGCYTIAPSGSKRYVDRSLCADDGVRAARDGRSSASQGSESVPPAKYIRGPRGGCYTITAAGIKRYVDRSLCR